MALLNLMTNEGKKLARAPPEFYAGKQKSNSRYLGTALAAMALFPRLEPLREASTRQRGLLKNH
jgi:hypothetical protein